MLLQVTERAEVITNAFYADYVAGTAVGPTTAASERRSLAIVQAGYESAQNEEPINLKVRFGEL